MFDNDQPGVDLVIIPMIFAHAAEYIIAPTHGFSARRGGGASKNAHEPIWSTDLCTADARE